MRYRSVTAISASLLLGASSLVLATSSNAQPQDASRPAATTAGSFALSGADAAAYRLPGDVTKVWSTTLPGGLTQTRYQQYVGNASVLGGQVTVIRDASGTASAVIGAHFPGLDASNAKSLNRADAREVVQERVGARGDWTSVLRIDPRTGKQFFEVDAIRDATRPVRWVNAANGEILNAYNAIAEGTGKGVKGDTKTIDTTQNGAAYELKSADGRQVTYDVGNTTTTASLMTDPDDTWDTNNTKMTSPSQAPGVDAHYYANVVDDFYSDTFGRNSIDGNGMVIKSFVHYDRNYCNAFWNGAYMTYGDGDGRSCLPLSGGLDVDGHELTHGVTEFTSGLIYENESGALNEAFSDMMGNTIEYYAESKGLDPAAQPDFRIGEDVINPGTAGAGFRNMGDPGEFGDPAHYSLRYTGTADNGGVHTNSGIANHAYYLAVNGGQNAGCTAPYQTYTGPDCAITVPAVGLARATQIFYTGFTSLTEYANFCDARNATVVATANGKERSAIGAAWDAVGVKNGCAPGTPPPPPCTDVTTSSVPFGSPHPYGNNGDCDYTFTNPAGGGYKLHFSVLDLEKDYDYLYLKDANGTLLATYTGAAKGTRGVDTPCISTPTAVLNLVTDAGVTAQGFTVDAVKPC
ncbi:M4 family metallopeptidase [Nocardioides iriomotensis]|uniref:Neutral metalloproteinase n=1 Tax=Nocardioides iriomotensis TaxID=715784 RepID=A0A4Q5J633_9ACTN|nr:M4 family metallopeptidase [Nocardioides iriomotensis]RYU13025.1 peptidase M4 [Nocardioides iriomotensis]